MVILLVPKNNYVFKRLFAGAPEQTVALINDLRPDLPQVASVLGSERQLTVIELKKADRLGQLRGASGAC